MIFPLLQTAYGTASGPSPTWNGLLSELWPLLAAHLTEETEEVLLDILHFDGRLKLDLSGEGPHSLCPELMLKSLAVQALIRGTGEKHAGLLDYLETEESLREVIHAARGKSAPSARSPQ